MRSSQAGLSYSEFWLMTPREWEAWMDGYLMRDEIEWQRIRWQTAMLMNVEGKFLKEPIKPMDLFKLPHDEEPILKTMSLDDRYRLVGKYKSMKTHTLIKASEMEKYLS